MINPFFAVLLVIGSARRVGLVCSDCGSSGTAMMSIPTSVQFLQATTNEPWMVWAVTMFVLPVSRSGLRSLSAREFSWRAGESITHAATSSRSAAVTT